MKDKSTQGLAEDKTAVREIRVFSALETEAANEKQNWQDISEFVMPRKSNITSSKTKGTEGWTDELYDEETISLLAGSEEVSSSRAYQRTACT